VLYNKNYANEIIYPNPFMDKTKIEFDVNIATAYYLSIFNPQGVEVRKLLSNNVIQEGKYQMIWDGKDGYGADLPNGNYIYQLHTNNGIHSSGKVTLNRN
jgi:flagellar hook assembly protein FlgD